MRVCCRVLCSPHQYSLFQLVKIMPTPNNRPSPEALLKALEDAKKILDTFAQTNRNLFIAFNSVLVTVLILCLSITDEMLLLGSSTITLPLLNVALPIWAFATIAPLALVALHFDLLRTFARKI